MIKKKFRLIDIYYDPLITGIFSSMAKNVSINAFFTKIGITDPISIDMEYFYNRSGLKTASFLLTSMFEKHIRVVSNVKYLEDFVIDSKSNRIITKTALEGVNHELINSLIVQKYLPIWERMYDNFAIEFDPVNPFYQDIIEKSSDNLSTNGTTENSSSASSTYNNTDTRDSSTERTSVYNENGDNKEYKYGYDNASEDGSPYSRDTNSNNRNQTDNDTDTYSGQTNGTNSGTTESDGKTTYNSDRNIDKSINRKGNIGNIPITELLQRAIEYYRFTIYDKIYSDLDGILTRSKYI